MPIIRDELLKSARQRSRRSSMMTADRYMRSMETCFDGEHCPARLFAAASPAQWQHSLKEAESRLVWTEANLLAPEAGHRRADSAHRAPGSVMDFEAVITTTRRDRDSDILESRGATVDPNAVLLWQHIPMLPIGRLLAITEQSDSRIKARLSIADTELGRDAATLAEFGALKISHGFEPVEFEPLPDRGWHIKRFEIYEISLVSVPSNRDAVITAFSRDKLHSPLMKQWASAFHRARPVRGTGAAFDRNREPEALQTCECRHHRQHGGIVAADDSCSKASATTMSATWIARALRTHADDLPTLKEAHRVVGQIIERLETKQQVSRTHELLRQIGL